MDGSDACTPRYRSIKDLDQPLSEFRLAQSNHPKPVAID